MKKVLVVEFMWRHAAVLWFLLVAIVIAMEIAYLAESAKIWQGSMLLVRWLKIGADALLIMLPYWYLSRRWRWAVLLPVWCVAVICICDSMYFRFFGDYMPFSMISQASNLDHTAGGSIWSRMKLFDVLAIVFPMVMSVLWTLPAIRRAVNKSRITCCLRTVMTVITLIIVSIAQYAHNKANDRILSYYTGKSYSWSELLKIRLTFDRSNETMRMYSMSASGFCFYVVKEFVNSLDFLNDIKLNDDVRSRFDDMLMHNAETDSIIDKSVIFIVAESLNADVIGLKINGTPVTPTLDSLIAAEGTVSCLNVLTQADKGMSSDGQLIYNLGVLPIFDGAVSPRHFYNESLPTIPAQLSKSRRSIAIFSEPGRTWNENDLYRCYGYSEIWTSEDIKERFMYDSIGADMATMQYASMMMDSIKDPVYMQVLTLSTHSPFRPNYVSDFCLFDNSGFTDAEQRYLRCVHYLDSSIACLVNNLRKNGKLSNTMLVIASDHNVNMDGSLMPLKPIAFIAANCDTSAVIPSASQIDVFTTVYELIGLRGRWRGMGRNMLQSGDAEPDYGMLRQISDSLIRSDYFR